MHDMLMKTYAAVASQGHCNTANNNECCPTSYSMHKLDTNGLFQAFLQSFRINNAVNPARKKSC